MINLSRIYSPVLDGLNKVEEQLGDISNVDIHLLKELLEYCIKNGGKRVRPAFTLLAGKFNNYNLDKLIPMASGVELLHSATLIHDDIVDNSDLRRGKPTVCRKWGRDAALLLGDYLFAKAGMQVASTGNLRVIKLFAQTLMTISAGELAQINVIFDLKRAREHYYEWISAKTACLFATSTESGAILSDATEEAISALRDFGYYFGMAFQVIDDILDFIGTESELGKPVGSDLIVGAVTLPTIIYTESEKGQTIVRKIIEFGDRSYIQKAIKEINKSSILDECIAIAMDFSIKARKSLDILPDNEVKEALVDLVDFMVKRKT